MSPLLYVVPPARRLVKRLFRVPQDNPLQRNIRLNTIHGLFNAAALNLVAPFVSIFAIRLGASKLHVAFLSSAPAIVGLLAMIPGARVIDRATRKRKVAYRFMFAHRAFYLALAALPFFAAPARPTLFVIMLALMNLPGAISNIAWQTYISGTIPAKERAGAFAARNRLMGIVGTAITLATGLFLDRAAFPVGYQIVAVLAFCTAVMELLVFNMMSELRRVSGADKAPVSADGRAIPKPHVSPPVGEPIPPHNVRGRVFLLPRVALRYGTAIRDRLSELASEKRFVRFTLFSMLFYLTWQIPWPLFSWYQVRELHANNMWVSILSLMNTGGALLGYGFWARVSNKYGNLRTLVMASLPIFIVPVAYAFSRNLFTIALFNFLPGAIFSGVNLVLFNTLLEVTPRRKTATYIAYYNSATTVSSVIAPLLGVSFLAFLDFRGAFLLSGLLRLLGSLGFLACYLLERSDRRMTAVAPAAAALPAAAADAIARADGSAFIGEGPCEGEPRDSI